MRRRLAAAVGSDGRILLIRRPGRRDRREPMRSWAVVDRELGSLWGSWSHDRDLAMAAETLHLPTWPHTRAESPILLVCTHGVHDACCAIRGRPVATALARIWPEPTWECSHVGGDRFAGNLIALPDGVYYGNLDPESAVQVVGGHLDGQVSVGHLRGFAAFPPVVQVAVGHVHERYGPFGAREVSAATAHRLGPARWSVEVYGPGRADRVVVETHRRSPARLTCAAVRETSATGFEVVAVEPIG